MAPRDAAPDVSGYISDLFRDGRAILEAELLEARKRILAPSPKMTLSEWVEKHGMLSAESSAEPGPFKAFGYQKGLMDGITDPANEVVAIKKSARVGYTQIANFAIGYFLEHDPTKVLFVLPNEDNISDYTKDSILPMFRDIKVLAEITGRGVSDDDKFNKFTSKGSVLHMRGAFSADTFRRITSRINIGDEIDADGWGGAGAKGQGDKIRLLRKRGETYWNSKLILGSTPLLKGSSRIDDWYQRGDQRRYFVPCPHCHEFQYLEWGDGKTFGISYKDDPENPVYICRHNGCLIEEREKEWMDANGEWRPTAEGERGFASFHISALYSLFPNASWRNLVAEWKDAQGDPNKLQPFMNLVLGEAWEDRSASEKAYEPHELEQNLVADYESEVPHGVRFLTAGVDTQSKDGGRFEVQIVGWGAGQRSAIIAHYILDKHPLSDPTAWTVLEDTLLRAYRTPDGRTMRVSAAAIDSGGHYVQEVYDFAARHTTKNWWAIKGHSKKGKGTRGTKIWPSSISANGKVYSIDVDVAKDTIYRRLHAEPGKAPAIVFPSSEPVGSVPFDNLFFTRLTREKPIPVKGSPGLTYWSDPADQEPWDCLVYALAAMHGLLHKSPDRYKPLVASPVRSKSPSTVSHGATPTPEPTSAPKAAPRPRPQSSGPRVSSFLKR